MNYGRIQRGPMAADIIGKHFVQICNKAARDKRLSRKARGFLVELLSHQDGYGVSVQSLVANGPEGYKAVYSGLQELEKFGYLTRTQIRDQETKYFGQVIYQVTDMPADTEPLVLSFHPDSPRSEPFGLNGDTEELVNSDIDGHVRTSGDPHKGHAAKGHAGNAVHKKTTFEEDQAFGTSSACAPSAPQGKEDQSSSSPSPLHGSVGVAVRENEEEEDDPNISNETGAQRVGLATDPWEQYFEEESEPEPEAPAPVCPSEVVDGLPWPQNRQPRGKSRRELCEAVRGLLEASWTREQIEAVVAARVTWAKAHSPARLVLKILKEELEDAREFGNGGSVGQEDALAQAQEERRLQLEEINACPGCNEAGYLPIDWSNLKPGDGWHGHGDKNLTTRLYELEFPEEAKRNMEMNAAHRRKRGR